MLHYHQFWRFVFCTGNARVFINPGIKIPHRYDRVPPVSADRIDLQRYPPVHERFDQSLALKHNVKVVDEKSEAKPTEQVRWNANCYVA
ncbi:hypothetical protein DPMN_056986 [Dreissena polymorpha]|uniref:Uncharacterized protein n=1 Tax=Dreissena polymorpha TaxID=45954 RepID=A0A9D4CSQ7_DREPO|nr:hypothetical protein DPMN_056986 [Dreissena polymorpha]